MEPKYEVKIDFDEASRAWKRNKINITKSTFQYCCGETKKNGQPCKAPPASLEEASSPKDEPFIRTWGPCGRHKVGPKKEVGTIRVGGFSPSRMVGFLKKIEVDNFLNEFLTRDNLIDASVTYKFLQCKFIARDGKIVAFVMFNDKLERRMYDWLPKECDEDYAHLVALAVHKDYRQQGLAMKLLSHVHRPIFLEINANNTPMRTLAVSNNAVTFGGELWIIE